MDNDGSDGGNQRIKIKIASNLYEEGTLNITVPGLVFEPKEKGGEVTLQQEMAPCMIIDVGERNTVTIKNTRFIMKSEFIIGVGKEDVANEHAK